MPPNVQPLHNFFYNLSYIVGKIQETLRNAEVVSLSNCNVRNNNLLIYSIKIDDAGLDAASFPITHDFTHLVEESTRILDLFSNSYPVAFPTVL